MNKEKDPIIELNKDLSLALVFVCKTLNIKPEHFLSLALANLLEEELDYIKHNENYIDYEELSRHQQTVIEVKNKLGSRILV